MPTKTVWLEDALRLAAEKRQEVRFPANEKVRLYLKDPEPMEIEGRLLDYSERGFRAAHQHRVLRAGQEVQFRHWRAEGRARVVWNRIVARAVESGFFILE